MWLISSDWWQLLIVLSLYVISHVRLFVTPWTITQRATQSMGFPKQEYWSGLPFLSPGDLPTQGPNLSLSPTLAGVFFTTEPSRKLPITDRMLLKCQTLLYIEISLNHHSNTLSRCFYCSILLLRKLETEKLIWLLKGRARIWIRSWASELGTQFYYVNKVAGSEKTSLCDSWNCCQIQFVNHARKSYSFIVMLLFFLLFNKSGIDLFILQAWLGVAFVSKDQSYPQKTRL